MSEQVIDVAGMMLLLGMCVFLHRRFFVCVCAYVRMCVCVLVCSYCVIIVATELVLS